MIELEDCTINSIDGTYGAWEILEDPGKFEIYEAAVKNSSVCD